ncbi:hypothetical protein FisN_20Hu017 [Fistulifera solaris]|uniref:Uncharacterized protein n=1 Tax=Fistulifera solaris TaxID=1519565 RepID=A0A1Z5KCD8_FISSO|nr:hypothetical protein FisN_20Hu017 [Fistulifera solaris]|eukprot:GAX23815.1 hypothetical protein FisN_20Hu017 [Fistulifera solaris]
MFRNIVSLFFLSFLMTVFSTTAYGYEDYDDYWHGDLVCLDWKLNAKKFKKAFAKWKAPPCYSFTFYDGASDSDKKIKRVIKNGKALNKKPYRALQTIDDFYKLIKTKCIQDCPDHGAYHCYIEYAKDPKSGLVYPSYVQIQEDPYNFVDYVSYHIEDFCVKKCAK